MLLLGNRLTGVHGKQTYLSLSVDIFTLNLLQKTALVFS